MAAERVAFDLAPSLGDVAVIEYVVTDRRTIVFALRPTHGGASTLTVRSLPLPRRELMRRVERLCQRFEARDLSYAAGARELYGALIGPREPPPRGVRSIAIIPDGELWRLPFQALAGKDGRFLVGRAAVFYAPSLTLLQIAAKRPRPARYDATLLAFANPVVKGSVAPDLRDSHVVP